MAFWCFMLLCDLLIPLTMILAGAVMGRRSPRRINRFFGYRTRRSMQNPDTWRFAQAYYGRLCRKMGWPAAAVTGCAQLLFLHSSPDMLGAFSAAAVLVQSALLVLSIFFTEKALKKKFGDL